MGQLFPPIGAYTKGWRECKESSFHSCSWWWFFNTLPRLHL